MILPDIPVFQCSFIPILLCSCLFTPAYLGGKLSLSEKKYFLLRGYVIEIQQYLYGVNSFSPVSIIDLVFFTQTDILLPRYFLAVGAWGNGLHNRCDL